MANGYINIKEWKFKRRYGDKSGFKDYGNWVRADQQMRRFNRYTNAIVNFQRKRTKKRINKGRKPRGIRGFGEYGEQFWRL